MKQMTVFLRAAGAFRVRRDGFGFAFRAEAAVAALLLQGIANMESKLQSSPLQFPDVILLAAIAVLLCGCSSAPHQDDSPLVSANMATQFGDAALPEAGTRLPTFSDDRASSVVIPDSGFIKQQLNAVHSLPFQPLGRDLGTDIVIGRASDDRYTAGVGWEDGDDNVKLSLLRQQSVGDGFDGLWLTSLQENLHQLRSTTLST
ncbi:hypothetical protein [Marinobacterium aestuariivivens]|uniref:Uncharacterized protein n=1 Tax=Marinobacterium aestuariivivens TaxID=1698799 RepID=A0ABW1ZXQ2_9GAMM